MKIRHASQEAIQKADEQGGVLEVYARFPFDPYTCVCNAEIQKLNRRIALSREKDRKELLEKNTPFVCPRDKTGMHRYEIVCAQCGEVQAYLWATDETLTDYCDFHYYAYCEDGRWYGCITPHVSPVTGQLCFECSCGNDTRDYRANMTLSAKAADAIERENRIGREFGKINSRFIARKMVT